jgi:prevent-host-death family protein
MYMTMKKGTEKRIPAGVFKAKCLALFDQVEANQESFLVTKRGRPVARIVPASTGSKHSLRGTILHEEDLLAPIDAPWNANA